MADPQTQVRQVEQRRNSPAVSALPAVDPQALDAVASMSVARAEQAFSQFRFDPLRVARNAAQNANSADLVQAHVRELTRGLRATLQELSTEQPRNSDELLRKQWTAFSQAALLEAFSQEAFKPFAPAIGEQRKAMLGTIEKYSESGNAAKLDIAFRSARILSEHAPQPDSATAKRLVEKVFEQTQKLPAQELIAYIDESVARTEKYLQGRTAEYAKDLRSILELAQSKPEEVDSHWQLLRPQVRVYSDAVRFVANDGQAWNVELLGRSTAKTSEAAQVVFRNAADGKVFVTFEANSLTETLRSGQLSATLTSAVADARAGNVMRAADPQLSVALDPAKTLVLSVHPAANDDVITNGGFGSLLLARGFGEQAAKKMIVSDNPLPEVIKALDAQVQAAPGTSDVVLDLNQHGTPGSLRFAQPIDARVLRELTERYPDLRFHVLSIACHGGGLVAGTLDQIAAHPELANRLTLFTQTKLQSRNMLSIYNPDTDSSAEPRHRAPLQQLLLARGLLSGTSDLGTAFRQADKATRTLLPLDAEAVIRGRKVP